MPVVKSDKGWCWHIQIYNYKTGEKKVQNSDREFDSWEEAIEDLLRFLTELKGG